MPDPNVYIYPDGITTETQVVVNIYQEYENQDDFYGDIGAPQNDTIENIAENYAVDKEISNTEYENNEPAPVFGQGVFQKQYDDPQLTGTETALEVATAYAGAGLVNLLGANAIIEGAGIIYENGIALVATEQAGAYAMGMTLGASGAACVAASAALAGWELGYEIAEQTGAHDYWTELLYETDPWKLKTPGSLMGMILGIQYNDKTYIDSRVYQAIKAKLDSWISYPYMGDYTHDGETYQVGASDVFSSEHVKMIISYECVNSHGTGSGGKWFEADVSGQDVRVLYVWKGNDSFLYGSLFGIIAYSRTSYPSITRTSWNTVGYEYNGSSGNPGYSFSGTGTSGDFKYRYYYMQTVATISGTTTRYFNPSPEPCYGDPSSYIPEIDASLQSALPTGIREWPGIKVDDPSQGAINVVVDVTTKTTVPFYPVGFPNAPFAFPSYNIDTQPNPSVTYNPTTQVVPYAVPWPTQNPESDPDKDPSNPTIVPVPVVIQSPAKDDDEGETPALVAPTIAPPFDLNYQYGGLFNVFNPTTQQLYDFGRFLWVTWTDATLDKIINNPFDGIISLHELYATPNTDTAKNITSGFIASQVSAATVTNRYSSVDCGTIVVPERYQNYLDYEPYTSAYIYLPFIGIVSVNADDIIGHAINITYKVDSYTGACVAIVTHARTNGDGVDYSNEVYQFEGNCAVQLPISGGTQAALTAGLWQVGSQAVGQGLLNIISGGGVSATGIIQGLLDTVGGVSTQLLTKKSEVQHSGTMGSNFGAMAGKKPYIIVKRPRQVSVVNYNRDYGFPAHAMVRIGSCNGYLRVREVNVISATATDEEKKKIEELLKSGVYVN